MAKDKDYRTIIDRAYAISALLDDIDGCVASIQEAAEGLAYSESRGQWKAVNIDNFGKGRTTVFCCSKCSQLVSHQANYCPNCGAHMEG